MKILLLLLIAVGLAHSQSMDVGNVNVRLGMSRLEVASSLPENYFLSSGDLRIRDANTMPDHQLLTMCQSDGNRVNCFGAIAFSGTRLSYADREWNTADPETLDSLLGAVTNGIYATTEGSERFVSCSIRNVRRIAPDRRDSGVTIRCGKRTNSQWRICCEGSPSIRQPHTFDRRGNWGTTLRF